MSRRPSLRVVIGVAVGVLVGFLPTILPAVGLGSPPQSPPVGTDSPPCGPQPLGMPNVPGVPSARNGLIAFDVTCGNAPGDIYLVQSNGSGMRHLTSGQWPEWSPDGQKLAYQAASASGNTNIFTINSDGSHLSNISNNGASDGQPSWSPDGTRIAFTSDRAGQYLGEIYTQSLQDGSLARLTTDSCTPHGTGADYCLVYNTRPVWSPDGKQIMFFRANSLCCGDIIVMNTDGTGRRSLVAVNGVFLGMSWSRDSQTVTWSDVEGIHIINADGSGDRILRNTRSCPDSGNCLVLGNAVWSPDSTTLAASGAAGVGGIYTLRPDGSGLANIVPGSRMEHISWQQSPTVIPPLPSVPTPASSFRGGILPANLPPPGLDTGMKVSKGDSVSITAVGSAGYGYEGEPCVGYPRTDPDGNRTINGASCGSPKLDASATVPSEPIGKLLYGVSCPAGIIWSPAGAHTTFTWNGCDNAALRLVYNDSIYGDNTDSYSWIATKTAPAATLPPPIASFLSAVLPAPMVSIIGSMLPNLLPTTTTTTISTTSTTPPATGSSVSGTVSDTVGKGIAGLKVALSNPQAGPTTTTDSSGRYAFNGLSAGRYSISTGGSPSPYNINYKDSGEFDLAAGQSIVHNTTLTRSSTITGHITDAAGVPVTDGCIFPTDPNLPLQYVATSTLASGEYTISYMEPGSYLIAFRRSSNHKGACIDDGKVADQYYDHVSAPAGATAVVLAEGGTRTGIDAAIGTASPPPPPPPPPVDRFGITSYDRMTGGAPHFGYFDSAYQAFTAQSNRITFLGVTVGTPNYTPDGHTVRIRLCGDSACNQILAEANPQITNYGNSFADIGDVAVNPGQQYYVVYYQPAAWHGQTWVTYWWAGGNSVSTSDQMQAVVKGFNSSQPPPTPPPPPPPTNNYLIQTDGRCANVRTGPDTTYQVVTCLANRTPIAIECQVRGGPAYTNDGRVSNVWDRLSSPNGGNYVSDILTSTPALLNDFTPGIPQCADGPVVGPPIPPNAHDCESFVADVTVLDGTRVNRGATFTKTWRLLNCGNTDWSDLTAVRIGGNFGPTSFSVPVTAPNSTADVSVTLTAPNATGIARVTYALFGPRGRVPIKNGTPGSFYAEINVVNSGGVTPPPPPPSSGNRYVALGDSIPYGHGLRDPGKNEGPSPEAYPSLIARTLGLNIRLRGTSCDLVGDQLAVSGAPSTPSNAQNGGIGCVSPVLPDQVAAAHLKASPPALVTLQVGADDVNFVGCLSSELGLPNWGIFNSENCIGGTAAKPAITRKVQDELGRLRSTLEQTISTIHADAPHASIVLLNYYQLAPQPNAALFFDGSVICRAILTKQEADASFRWRFWNDATLLQHALNNTISQVAGAHPEIVPVNIANVFLGQELCTSPDGGGGSAREFTALWSGGHPTALGQGQIASAIERECRMRSCVGR